MTGAVLRLGLWMTGGAPVTQPGHPSSGARPPTIVPRYNALISMLGCDDDLPPKITFGELRESGVRDVLIYCRDHRCSHYLQRRPRPALQYRTRLRLHHPRQARRGCQAAVRTGGHGTGGQKYPGGTRSPVKLFRAGSATTAWPTKPFS